MWVFSATITQNVKNLNFLEFSHGVFSKRDKLKQLKQINCHQDWCHRAHLRLKSYLRISFEIPNDSNIIYSNYYYKCLGYSYSKVIMFNIIRLIENLKPTAQIN